MVTPRSMSERSKILASAIAIMVVVSAAAGWLSVRRLYTAAFEEQRARLTEVVQSRARLIEAMAAHAEAQGHRAAERVVLRQVLQAHERFLGFGETGEFTLARLEDGQIRFLLSHRHADLAEPRPVPLDSELAEPMRRALRGASGTLVGLDYRGATVLAAHEPVEGLGWGVVAKIDRAEVVAPFMRAGGIAAAITLLVIAAGAALMMRLISPLLGRLATRTRQLQTETDERRQAERALRESLQRHAAILEAAVDGIIVIDEAGRVESVNEAALRVFGYEEAELVGRNVNMLMPSPEREHHDEYLARYLRTGEPHIIGVGREVQGLRKDGTRFPMELSVSEVRLPERRLFTGMVRDISRRVQLEEQIRQGQMTEAVGRLAAGVAHDFNNLLGVIQGSSELLVERTTHNGGVREAAERIQCAAERGAALTRGLLALGRREAVKPVVLELNTRVGEMRDLLQRSVGQDVEIVLSPSAEDAAVLMDPVQVDQILLNLVLNANDAMPDGGRIQVDTRPLGLCEDEAAPLALVPGRYAELSVRDTGHGMDSDTRTRIFEPFFTTKGECGGTGLGLSTVADIVRAAGGAVEVESAVGRGSRFRVFLPAVDAVAREVATPEPVGTTACGHETVLVVEDDPLLCDLVEDMLTREGYRVLVATDASQALSLCRESDPLDLVLSDVFMPGTRGPELVAKMREFRPGLRVLFMSGHGEAELSRGGVGGEDAPLIRKPFTRDQLVGQLRRLLDRPAVVASTPAPPTNGAARVLVVDDDRATRETLHALLDAEGIEVCCAESADQALDMVRSGTFHVVLADMEMPAKSGFDLLRALSAESEPLPVLLMTGFASEDTSAAAWDAGAAGFLPKPLQRAQILTALRGAAPGHFR